MPEDVCHSRGSADHTLHFHALFTSSLAPPTPLCIPKHRSRTTWDQWMTRNQIFMPGTPKMGHVSAGGLVGGLQKQLPATCPPEKSRVREGSVCCWRSAAGNGWVLSVFAPVRLPCWFSACCFVCVQTKTSSSYSANHQTNNAYAMNCM